MANKDFFFLDLVTYTFSIWSGLFLLVEVSMYIEIIIKWFVYHQICFYTMWKFDFLILYIKEILTTIIDSLDDTLKIKLQSYYCFLNIFRYNFKVVFLRSWGEKKKTNQKIINMTNNWFSSCLCLLLIISLFRFFKAQTFDFILNIAIGFNTVLIVTQ